MEKYEFNKRFRKLYDMSGCSYITQFAKKLDMNRQSVDRYYNGERCPDAPALAQICEKMNVSADWLLGLSETKSVDADVKAAVSVIGLSEQAVNRIINPDELGSYKNELSHLIEQKRFQQLMIRYSLFLRMFDLLDNSENSKWEMDYDKEDHTFNLSESAAIEFIKELLADEMRNICEDEESPQSFTMSAEEMTREWKRRDKEIAGENQQNDSL